MTAFELALALQAVLLAFLTQEAVCLDGACLLGVACLETDALLASRKNELLGEVLLALVLSLWSLSLGLWR